jgi:peptide/nickel transport system permease protein
MIRNGWRMLLTTPSAALGIAVMLVACLGALFAPWLAVQNPFDLASLSIADSLLPPGSVGSTGTLYPLGTDEQGRDIFSAVLYGLRISLGVATVATLVACMIGTAAGMIAAYSGGWLDALLMRLADVQLAFPGILVALVLMAVFGSGLDKVVIAIVAVQWAYYARTARSAALVERKKEYILAARNLQFSTARIIGVHLLPNSVSVLAVVIVIQMSSAVALEATLSFLGVGLPITKPSLGLLIANGYSSMLTGEYWLSFYPGIVLVAVLLATNLVGERLRELNDPKGLA